MKQKTNLEKLKDSRLYSEELGISLSSNTDHELFKWFLASILFGARISETIAINTYRIFETYDLLNPQQIIKAGFDFLVYPIMREGGYVRYDGRTSNKILKISQTLLKEYGGSLRKLHEEATNSKDLENRLMAFYGVGPVTVNIFLRELRPFWEKADPEPLPIIKRLAERYSVNLLELDRKSITFARIEAGLFRLRRVAKHNSNPPSSWLASVFRPCLVGR